jgi:hypothetical protein
MWSAGSHDVDHHNAWKQRSKEYFANKKRKASAHGNLAVNNMNNMNTNTNTNPETPQTPSVPVAGGHLSMLKWLVHFADE